MPGCVGMSAITEGLESSNENNISRHYRRPGGMTDLQVSVVVLAEELHQAENRLHDGDDDTHFTFILALINCRDGGTVSGSLMLFGLSLTPVSCVGLLGDGGGLHQLLLHLLCHHGNHRHTCY